jgi:hypothetical protein
MYNHFSAVLPRMAAWGASALLQALSSLGAAIPTLAGLLAASRNLPYATLTRKLPHPISSFPSSAPLLPESNPHS